MNPSNKMSQEEYKREINRIHRSGKAGSGSSDNTKAKAIFDTIRTVRSLQTDRPDIVFAGSYELDVFVFGKTRADEDNIRKAINDALQGVATRNDRDSRGGRTELCGSANHSERRCG